MQEKEFHYKEPFKLELGEELKGYTLAYCTWGTLNKHKDNAIWICHALTANADVDEWWDGMIGPGKIFDTARYFIICANIPGSCYGSTGPLSINPDTQKPYYKQFPRLTIRDIIYAFENLRIHLGIHKLHTCIGGSLGGQQALEWAIINPDVIHNLVLLASNAWHSPWGIAFNESQRLAIEADQTWHEDHPRAGENGLKAARSIALLSYRSYQTFLQTQYEEDINRTENYKAITYQQYQGEKLVKRFNAHSYFFLTKAMDSHNVGRNRNGVEKALKYVKARTLVINIDSDLLFPESEQEYLARYIDHAVYMQIESLYGHDGFLIETEKISACLRNFWDTTG